MMVIIAGPGFLAGCRDRSSAGATGSAATSTRQPDARNRPALEFPKRVQCDDPSVNRFIEEFYEACCKGDYDRFRLMMSTRIDPFTPERFKKALEAVEVVRIVSVDLLPDVADVPPPIYLVRAHVRLRQEVKKPERERTIAILVLKEADKWVMFPAPPELRDGVDVLYEVEDVAEGEAQAGGVGTPSTQKAAGGSS